VIAPTQLCSVDRCPGSGRCRCEHNTSWPTGQQARMTEQTCALADHCLRARQSPANVPRDCIIQIHDTLAKCWHLHQNIIHTANPDNAQDCELITVFHYTMRSCATTIISTSGMTRVSRHKGGTDLPSGVRWYMIKGWGQASSSQCFAFCSSLSPLGHHHHVAFLVQDIAVPTSVLQVWRFCARR